MKYICSRKSNKKNITNALIVNPIKDMKFLFLLVATILKRSILKVICLTLKKMRLIITKIMQIA